MQPAVEQDPLVDAGTPESIQNDWDTSPVINRTAKDTKRLNSDFVTGEKSGLTRGFGNHSTSPYDAIGRRRTPGRSQGFAPRSSGAHIRALDDGIIDAAGPWPRIHAGGGDQLVDLLTADV